MIIKKIQNEPKEVHVHVCQIGEQICTFGKNFDFPKIISLNGNKIKSQADSNS